MPKPIHNVSRAVIARIRRERLARRMSTQELADAVTAAGYYVTRGNLAMKETATAGERGVIVSVDLLHAVAQVFDLPVADLLSLEPCHACGDAPPPGFTCNTCGALRPE